MLYMGGGLILCCCLYQFLTVEIGSVAFFRLLFYFGSMLLEQFTYCWFGNEVQFKVIFSRIVNVPQLCYLQSSKILNAIYNTPWVECDQKYKKIALQFMTQVTNPINMRAGLLEISVGTFLTVC